MLSTSAFVEAVMKQALADKMGRLKVANLYVFAAEQVDERNTLQPI